MKTEVRGTAIEGGRGNVATTFQVMPSQWTIRLREVEPSGKLPVPKYPTAHPSVGVTM
jgi:hypothetical protein